MTLGWWIDVIRAWSAGYWKYHIRLSLDGRLVYIRSKMNACVTEQVYYILEIQNVSGKDRKTNHELCKIFPSCLQEQPSLVNNKDSGTSADRVPVLHGGQYVHWEMTEQSNNMWL